MKLAYVCAHFNKTGGIERVAAEIAKRVSAEHEVHVYATSWDESVSDRIVFHRVPVHVRKPLFLMWADFFFTCGSILRREHGTYDIIHAHCPVHYPVDVITAHSVHKAGVDLLLKTEPTFTRRVVTWMKTGYPVIMPVAAYNYRNGRHRKVVAVSSGVKNEIVRTFGTRDENVVVIPNGVNREDFNSENRSLFRRTIRERYGIGPDETVLLFAGKEFRRKGLEYLVRALPLIRSRNVRLMVVGRSVDKPGLEHYMRLADELKVRDRIIFAGHTDRIREFFAAADMFVFPTHYEAFALVSLEAAASGLPLLMPHVNGTDELLQDGYNGYFIERSPESIAGRVNEMIDDGKCRKMGMNAAETAALFSWDAIADRTTALYREILDRESGK